MIGDSLELRIKPVTYVEVFGEPFEVLLKIRDDEPEDPRLAHVWLQPIDVTELRDWLTGWLEDHAATKLGGEV